MSKFIKIETMSESGHSAILTFTDIGILVEFSCDDIRNGFVEPKRLLTKLGNIYDYHGSPNAAFLQAILFRMNSDQKFADELTGMGPLGVEYDDTLYISKLCFVEKGYYHLHEEFLRKEETADAYQDWMNSQSDTFEIQLKEKVENEMELVKVTLHKLLKD